VAVPCRGCGREYDVTLFEFGRTIWCTCGSRVGIEPRTRGLRGVETRFVADAMLGKLARWLRILGFDCAWDADVEDSDLVYRGVVEERIILTRDRALPEEWWVSDIHVVGAEEVRSQLVEVIRRFRLVGEIRLLTRCADCNLPLVNVAPGRVAARVPAGVRGGRERFTQCPGCERVYWEGSHTERIRRTVDRLLEAI
jgi:uncharacterized protein with PIN domain